MDARDRAYGSTSLRAASHPGYAIASEAFGTLFTFQTAHLVPAMHFCARGLQLCFAHPNRGVGGAPRNVRGLGGTPVGRIMCVKDARERAYDARRSPLGAPPWRFWAPGAALPSPALPPDPCSELLAPRS